MPPLMKGLLTTSVPNVGLIRAGGGLREVGPLRCLDVTQVITDSTTRLLEVSSL